MKKILAVVLLVMSMPLVAMGGSFDLEDNIRLSDITLNKKCPSIAILYMGGDRINAQKQAREMLSAVELKYRERHNTGKIYDYACELKMLRAVVYDDQRAVEYYMNNCYHPPDVALEGLKFGLDEQLGLHERALELIAAEPLGGTLCRQYLIEGCTVAAIRFINGQTEKAHELADHLLPLITLQRAERSKELADKTGMPTTDKYSFEQEESILNAIVNNNDDVMAKYMKHHTYIEDSIGARLEEAYGRIYLYKRLHKDLPLENKLAYAYKYLGWVQAIAGNYDESERAYTTALKLAQEKYGRDYPWIPMEIRSEYSGMLKVAKRNEEATKLAEGLTPEAMKEAKSKSRMEQGSRASTNPLGWGL